MKNKFHDEIPLAESEIPLSESNVSVKLAVIQLRCMQLLQDTEDSIELTLEEAVIPSDAFNPYDRA